MPSIGAAGLCQVVQTEARFVMDRPGRLCDLRVREARAERDCLPRAITSGEQEIA